jgi:hypothetical protein
MNRASTFTAWDASDLVAETPATMNDFHGSDSHVVKQHAGPDGGPSLHL